MTDSVPDAAYENYYRAGFKYSHGYDPLDPEDRVDVEEDPFDPEWDGWVKESERKGDY